MEFWQHIQPIRDSELIMTMSVIEHIEVGSGGAASITFSSIPQTYTDLYLLVSGRNTLDNFFLIYPNGSSSDGSLRFLRGTGSAANSGTAANISSLTGYDARTSNTFGNTSVYIPNYTSSNAKSFSFDAVEENNATDSQQRIDAALWNPSPQAAITSLQLVAGASGAWMQYSSATLYGITAGSDGVTSVS